MLLSTLNNYTIFIRLCQVKPNIIMSDLSDSIAYDLNYMPGERSNTMSLIHKIYDALSK